VAEIKQSPARLDYKAGRADTPTDRTPLSMRETAITLKPKSQ
jgi:Cu/Ag efflux pump CusA